jgi:prevent-host-death family protein
MCSGGDGEGQLRDAKANLSAVIDEAIKGEEFLITRHGRPEAVLIGFEEWRRLSAVPSFGRLLMAAPEAIAELRDRDTAGLGDSDI